MNEREQPSEREIKIEQFKLKTGDKFRRLCDAQQLLDRNHGNKGWGGKYIGPEPEEREAAQQELDNLKPEIFNDVVRLFKEVGGQEALDTFNGMEEEVLDGRDTEAGNRFQSPFSSNPDLMERVLVEATTKENTENK